MEEIQGLYAWGQNQDGGTFSKFSPLPAHEGVGTVFATQPLYTG